MPRRLWGGRQRKLAAGFLQDGGRKDIAPAGNGLDDLSLIILLGTPRPEILYTWEAIGQKGQLVQGLTTRTIHSYIAASKTSPAIDVAQWRTTFAAMEQEGRVKAIIDSYLGR